MTPTTTSSGRVVDRPAALVRGIPQSFADAITSNPPDPPLSVEVASRQHADYVSALRSGGYSIIEVEPDEAHPDCCFIEDTAVAVGDHALLTRTGHESRRGEGEAVAPLLEAFVRVHRAKAPATIDGGDVLVAGSRVFVGLSRRTNAAGAAAIAALAEPQGLTVDRVAVGPVLHLKSGVAALDDTTVIWHPLACDRSTLTGVQVVEAPGPDPEAANVVRLADGRILVGTRHPATREVIEALGFETVTVDVSEIARADGGLTCMSIRLR
jgi:dimethylargininase